MTIGFNRFLVTIQTMQISHTGNEMERFSPEIAKLDMSRDVAASSYAETADSIIKLIHLYGQLIQKDSQDIKRSFSTLAQFDEMISSVIKTIGDN